MKTYTTPEFILINGTGTDVITTSTSLDPQHSGKGDDWDWSEY